MVPHAGYVYSGPAAAHVYARVSQKSVVVLGTNHTGMGHGFDTSDESWLTPLGEMPIDTKLRSRIAKHCDLHINESAHAEEHSIEVQLPFLQAVGVKSFVPISVSHLPTSSLTELGAALQKANAPLVIASSDFSHYVTQKLAEKIDMAAIELVLENDTHAFWQYVKDNHASICGVAPIFSLMTAMSGKKGKLFKYYTSGEVTGDRDHVVGYAAIGFK